MELKTGVKHTSSTNSTTPKRAFGRSLSDFPNLNAAEKKLIACCAKGATCVLGDGTRPDASTKANTIRAGLIRFLALGGDDSNPVQEEGVYLTGARVIGQLNLNNTTINTSLALISCWFEEKIFARDAKIVSLALSGSSVPGMAADRISVTGSIFMRDGFISIDQICLLGANIGGNLECADSKFQNCDQEGQPAGYAIHADLMRVQGSVLFRPNFSALGAVQLIGARIGGNLECQGGLFSNSDQEGNALGDALFADRISVEGSVLLTDGFMSVGAVRMAGAKIGSSFESWDGIFLNRKPDGNFGEAIVAANMRVKGSLYFEKATFGGGINMTDAWVGSLVDDNKCWTANGTILDGFRYDSIAEGSVSAAERISWLNRQLPEHLGASFRPQPWEQLIRVLREMGHIEDAATVAIAKQEQLRKASGQINGFWRRGLHWTYGWLVGYGHRPIWALIWMGGVWLALSLLFMAGAHYGYIGPSTPLLNSPTLAPAIDVACGHAGQPGKQNWTECSEVPAEYSTFQPFIYSLDLILPLVDLQQDSDWAPIVEDPPGTDLLFGVILRWAMWFEILFGWVASLTLVAVLGRLVEKD